MKNILYILIFLSYLPASALKVVKVVPAEYRIWYVYDDGNIWGYGNNPGTYIVKWNMPGGVTSWSYVGTGFNYLLVIDQVGKLYYTDGDPSNHFVQIATDTTGASITGTTYATSFSSANMYIASDGSLWYGNVDVYSFWYAGGNIFLHQGTTMAYTQLSAPGLSFTKVVMGGSVILGLATDGTVYKWVPGNRTPTHYTTARAAIDVFAGSSDMWGYIMPNAAGNQSMGYPYVAGTAFGMWGGGGAISTPTSLASLWSMTAPIKEFGMSTNTFHWIDSIGRLYGGGFNPMGEVGNGVEHVGEYTYSTYPSYAWSGASEYPIGLPVRIGTDTDWKHVWKVNWFGFYTYASKTNDSLYSWGRNKSYILGNGRRNRNWTTDGTGVDEFHQAAADVIVPTQVTPLSIPAVTYDWTAPALSAGTNTTINSNSTTLLASGHTLLGFAISKPAANGIDTVGYHYISYAWSKISGPSGVSFGTPTAQSTTVTFTQNGTYVFQVLGNNDRSGQDMAQVTITVAINQIRISGGTKIKYQ